MPELEIGLVDGCKLNFNQSFLKFNVKKKIEAESYSQFDFKGYLGYKTITSPNLSSEAQIKNFCYFVEKICSILKVFKFLHF